MKFTFLPLKRSASLAVGSLLFVALTNSFASAAQYKHVAVPPEQMAQQALANAKSKGIFSHSTMLPLMAPSTQKTSVSGDNLVEEINQTIHFDGREDSPIIFIGPNSEDWQLTLTDPNGQQVYSEQSSAKKRLPVQDIQVGNQSFKGKQLMMTAPSIGAWQVSMTRVNQPHSANGNDELSAQKLTPIKANAAKKSQGYLMFKGDPNFQVYSYIDNNFTVQNSQLNLVAYSINAENMAGKRKMMQQRKALQGTITRAVATIRSPSDRQSIIELKDDGLNGDALAGDGLFSGSIPSDEVGVYTSQVQIEGVRPDGIRYSRTTTDLYPVAKATFAFADDSATIRQADRNTAVVSIPVEQLDEADSVFLSAEIWGRDTSGRPQSAVWIGGIATPTVSAQSTQLELGLDLRWLERNRLRPPYTLRDMRLQTVEDNVPLSYLAAMAVKTDRSIEKNLSRRSATIESSMITQDMLSLVAPGGHLAASSKQQAIHPLAVGGKLMLVHGYCSSDVWNASQFADSVKFQDFNQNRSHDAFANQINSFGSAYSSYGIVAHSQGGAAALHLYAKYWSGLDNASGGRLIQSVGTPYQGTSLAGNLAVLGEIFGAGCGKNTDLTYSGASNWLSTIPSWARAEVDYYTTSFKDRWWAYDYCHLVTDLLLNDPDDGTTEKWSGQLSGAVNKGHKTGWCHTNGMRDTAQFKDSSRNASMSSRAAR